MLAGRLEPLAGRLARRPAPGDTRRARPARGDQGHADLRAAQGLAAPSRSTGCRGPPSGASTGAGTARPGDRRGTRAPAQPAAVRRRGRTSGTSSRFSAVIPARRQAPRGHRAPGDQVRRGRPGRARHRPRRPRRRGQPRLPLNLEMISGGELDLVEDAARTRTRYVIRLPRPLRAGEAHEYETRIQVLARRPDARLLRAAPRAPLRPLRPAGPVQPRPAARLGPPRRRRGRALLQHLRAASPAPPSGSPSTTPGRPAQVVQPGCARTSASACSGAGQAAPPRSSGPPGHGRRRPGRRRGRRRRRTARPTTSRARGGGRPPRRAGRR